MRRSIILLAMLLTACGASAQAQTKRLQKPTKPRGEYVKQSSATGQNGVVTSGGAESVSAGMAMFKAGGNACDAAAATLLAQTVTDANNYCTGGEVPIIVYNARRQVVEVLSGQGAAPRLATREFFVKKGGIPDYGITPATVPAALDVIVTLLDRHGTKTFAEAVAFTLEILDRKEYAWHADLARTYRRLVEAEKTSPNDRSQGLRRVADYFYRGPIAREIDAWSRQAGALVRYNDLASHVTRIEDPVTLNYRGYTICKCGPWSQGPFLLQTLQLLQGYDLKSLGHNKPAAIHLITEAMKLGFADRDVYYADPYFEDVPLTQLLAPKYADMRRALIDPQKASLAFRPGDPRGGKALLDKNPLPEGIGGESNDTTTCATADSQGNMVATTPSGWAGVVAGETGIWLGSRLQSFNLWEGHPNCIAPGKLPRISLTPTLVLKDGKPVIAISVAGGDGQDQAGLQVLLNVIDFGLSPRDAVGSPRFTTNHLVGSFRQTPPRLGDLRINPEVGDEALAELKRLGHKVQAQRGGIWQPSVIVADPISRKLEAAGDPRGGRHSGGY